jgi:hypothetical protein
VGLSRRLADVLRLSCPPRTLLVPQMLLNTHWRVRSLVNIVPSGFLLCHSSLSF